MILITGASGFVGAHLLEYLAGQSVPIRALYHKQEPPTRLLKLNQVEWVQADLLDIYDVESVMQGVSHIYHCAAIISFNPRRREEMIHVNTEITSNLVNEALDTGVKKLVHISSIAALGRNGIGKEVNEEAQWEESVHNSGYGMSKYAAELEVWRGIGEGLEACILNPGIILGAAMSVKGWEQGSARLMKTAHDEFPFYTDGVTAFVDVNDVVRAAVSLMQSEITGERFILSAGNRPFREILGQMAVALGKKPAGIHAGNFLTELVWRFVGLKSRLTGSPAFLTKETARNAQSQSIYKNDKILQFLPDFKYTPLEETITQMANSYLKSGAA